MVLYLNCMHQIGRSGGRLLDCHGMVGWLRAMLSSSVALRCSCSLEMLQHDIGGESGSPAGKGTLTSKHACTHQPRQLCDQQCLRRSVGGSTALYNVTVYPSATSSFWSITHATVILIVRGRERPLALDASYSVADKLAFVGYQKRKALPVRTQHSSSSKQSLEIQPDAPALPPSP